jgi:hypothetical protein
LRTIYVVFHAVDMFIRIYPAKLDMSHEITKDANPVRNEWTHTTNLKFEELAGRGVIATSQGGDKSLRMIYTYSMKEI